MMSNVSTTSQMSAGRRRYLERVNKEHAEQQAIEQAAADVRHEAAQKVQKQAETRAFAQLAKLLWKVQKLKAATGTALYDCICASQHAADAAKAFHLRACFMSAAACGRQAAEHARSFSLRRADWAVAAVIARQSALRRVDSASAHARAAAAAAHAAMVACVNRSAALYARWAARQAKAMSKWAGWWCWWAAQHKAEIDAVAIAIRAKEMAEIFDERGESQALIAVETREFMRVTAAKRAANVAANMANDGVQFVVPLVRTVKQIVDSVSQEWFRQQEVLARKKARALAEAQKQAYLAAKKSYYASLRAAKAASEAASCFAKNAHTAYFDMIWRLKMEGGGPPFQIWIRTLGEATTIPMEVNNVVTVEMVKSRIELSTGQPMHKQRLVFVAKGAKRRKSETKQALTLAEFKERADRGKRGSELNDEDSVDDCGITAGETVILDFMNDKFHIKPLKPKPLDDLLDQEMTESAGDPLDSIGFGAGGDPLDSIGSA
jgi:hypothetical protein